MRLVCCTYNKGLNVSYSNTSRGTWTSCTWCLNLSISCNPWTIAFLNDNKYNPYRSHSNKTIGKKKVGVRKVGLHFLIEDRLTMGLEITDDDLNLSYILDKQFQLVFQIFQSCTHFPDWNVKIYLIWLKVNTRVSVSANAKVNVWPVKTFTNNVARFHWSLNIYIVICEISS